VICLDNEDNPASLEVGKVYRTLGAPEGGPQGYLIVFDESGEEYLFPARLFHAIELPQEVERALTRKRPAR
jgi:hypothetical protein